MNVDFGATDGMRITGGDYKPAEDLRLKMKAIGKRLEKVGNSWKRSDEGSSRSHLAYSRSHLGSSRSQPRLFQISTWALPELG